MKKSFRLMIALACAGIICSFICAIYLGNKTENKFNSSEEYEDIADTDNSKEEQHNPEEEKKYYYTWEIEHVPEIEFGYNEFVTQDDIIHIGQLIHLKRLKISIDESEIDLSPLSSLVELESLDIDIQYGCSPDLTFLENLSQLEKLDITVGSGVNLSPLGSLNDLRQLSIDTWGDEIDLSFLRKLYQLEEVTIDKCCAIGDLSLFQNMPNLQRIDISYINDCNLDYLADLNNLETLAIMGENIRNPQGLSELTHLKSLSLYDNSSDAMYGDEERKPLDLRAFANLTELEWLDLYYIYIEDISPLAELKNLRQISLICTDVRDILPLASLEKLDELFLFGNRSELIEEQAETLFDQVEYKIVTEKMPETFEYVSEVVFNETQDSAVEKGRMPAPIQYNSEIVDYDPEDTIYYKTYYDDFYQGKIMNIDYHPHMDIREELEDYFFDDSETFYLDYLAGMFYDDRTIETDEKELEQLFLNHGYVIYFHNAEFQNFHLRFIEIAEKEGLSIFPICILMQTWDDDFIYLQDITGPLPRKIRDLMVVDKDGVWQMIVHSSGFSKELIPEEELSFWEFTGTYWILVPMELEIDTTHAFYEDYPLYPDLDRDGLFEAIFYRDGIVYRSDMQPYNKWGSECAYRLGKMVITEENRLKQHITDGYYAIVLPSNRILRYDSDTDWYEFHEGE